MVVELHNLCFPINIARIIKQRSERKPEHVANMRDPKRMGNMNEQDRLIL
jgi:hypothetical protein